MVDDVSAALASGVRAIHSCFDPVPGGEHWFAFMDEIERRGIRVNMIFESFGLPGRPFLERFARVFPRGLVVISAETADERIRRRVRGFPFTNAELESTLALVGRLGLHAQVFLGYFVPFESLASLHRTRRWARRLAARHAGHVEVLHYPYSTDPGSPLARHPSRFGMRCGMRSAADYERELAGQEPWLGNLLRHEPATDDDWRAASLGIEIEQACLRHEPRLHASLEGRLGRRLDRFFLDMARGLLARGGSVTLDRARLRDVLVGEVVA
jgi:hypothetical protein